MTRILAFLFMCGVASAQPSGFSKPLIPLNQDGQRLCTGTSLDLSASDFSCSCSTGSPVCTLLPVLKKCVGLAADFCGTVTRTSSTNIDGTIYGGTGDTDTLTLSPSNSATYHGSINLCGGNPNVSTNSFNCTQILNANMSVSDGTTNAVVGISGTGSITQATEGGGFGTPLVYFFRDLITHQVTDSALNATKLGQHVSYDSAPTLKNNTDDNIAASVGAGYIGFYAHPSLVKGSTGTLGVTEYDSFLSGPNTIASGVTITSLYDYKAPNLTTVTGTLTNRYGFYADIGTGTNQYPYTAVEHTIAATGVTGQGSWGVETGAPNRFFFENESSQIWRMGYSTFTAQIGALGADNTTRFVEANGLQATPNATESNVDDFACPGPIHVYAIACGTTVAPTGATKTRTFTVRTGAAGSLSDTSVACTMTDTAKKCNGRTEAGVACAEGQVMTIKSTAANTPSATTGNETTCTIYWNLDAF